MLTPLSMKPDDDFSSADTTTIERESSDILDKYLDGVIDRHYSEDGDNDVAKFKDLDPWIAFDVMHDQHRTPLA